MSTKTDGVIVFHELEGIPFATAVEATDVANKFPRHAHSGYIFSVVDRGKRKTKFGSEIKLFSTGEMCILPPGTSHSCESISGDQYGPHSYRALCVTSSFMQKIAQDISGKSCEPPNFNATNIYKKYDAHSFNEIFSLLTTPGAVFEMQAVINSFLYHAIIKLSSGSITPEETGPQLQALERVKNYIDKNFNNKFTLYDLSKTGCISPYHLQKLFVKTYGLSPQEYTISKRVHEAEKLLRNGFSLTETAFESGFSDQSHFSRHFKRVIGISPGRFVKENI